MRGAGAPDAAPQPRLRRPSLAHPGHAFAKTSLASTGLAVDIEGRRPGRRALRGGAAQSRTRRMGSVRPLGRTGRSPQRTHGHNRRERAGRTQGLHQDLRLPDERLRFPAHGRRAGARWIRADGCHRGRRSRAPQHLPHPREGRREDLFRARAHPRPEVGEGGAGQGSARRRDRLRGAGGRGRDHRARAGGRSRDRPADLSSAAGGARARRQGRARGRDRLRRRGQVRPPAEIRKRPPSPSAA